MKKIIFSLLTVSIIFLACTKKVDNDPEVIENIQGLWIGTFLDNNKPEQPASPFSLAIYPSGKIIVETSLLNQSFYALGTWNLNGSNFHANYIYLEDPAGANTVQQIVAKYDSTSTMQGMWSDKYTQGSFIVEKVE